MKTAIVGWRGMVGSVLMQRMRDEKVFDLIEPVFFSTSNAGGVAPRWVDGAGPLQNAYDTDELKKLLNEFKGELAVLKGRVDGLDAKVGQCIALGRRGLGRRRRAARAGRGDHPRPPG